MNSAGTSLQPKENVTSDVSKRECDSRLKAEQRAEVCVYILKPYATIWNIYIQIYALNEVMTKLEEENFQSNISAKV